MRSSRARSASVLATAVACLWGCGYALVGTGRGILPENVKTVYVASFVNETARVGLEQRLTESVLRELSARSRLKPVSDKDKADSELTATLASYQVDPVRFDGAGRVVEYQISVVAKVKLVERASDKALFEEGGFLYRQPYVIGATSASYLDVENGAVEALARPFARSLVSTLLEGF